MVSRQAPAEGGPSAVPWPRGPERRLDPLTHRRLGDLLGRREMSVVRATLEHMEVTEKDVERIPVRNLRVPLEEFVAVWVAAEFRNAEQAEQGVTDWYAGVVIVTCRWLARAVMRPSSGPRYLARPPVSRHDERAYEELIEAEYLAAELLDVRRPDLVQARPGWCEAIRATLGLAWRRSGWPPIVVPVHATG